MRQIFKKISIEDCISRTPSILPALKNEWVINYGNLYKRFSSYSDAYNNAVHGSIDVSNIWQQTVFKDFHGDDALSSEPNGNYGLIVSDVEIPEDFVQTISDYTDFNVNVRIPEDEDYDGEVYYLINKITSKALLGLKEKCERKVPNKGHYYFIYGRDIYSTEITEDLWKSDIQTIVSNAKLHKYLTYRTLNTWYRYFNEYYLLLRSGNGKVAYKNALEFYEYEVDFKSDETKLKYKSYDDTFKARGGNDFYNWIIKNCIPRFYITDFNGVSDVFLRAVADYWGCKYLCYQEAIKWASWFNNRYELYGGYESLDDCYISDRCCDCSEYFKRGGNFMRERLNKWVKSISACSTATNSASMTIQISLSRNIDDIGEMSIFSNEYKERVNYSTTIDAEKRIKGFSGGTVIHRPIITDGATGNVFVDDNSYMIKDDAQKGFVQNEYFENVFDPKQWVDYTSYYINKYPDEFVSKPRYYAFNHKNEIVFDPTSKKMAEKYEVTRNDDGFILVDGNMLPIVKRKYVEYEGLDNSLLNGLIFPVDETADGKYFTQINGKTYFAVQRSDGYFYFNFKNITNCSNVADYTSKVKPIGNDTVETISYQNSLYLLQGNVVEIENGGIKHKYPRLDGFVDIDCRRYYVSGRNIVEFDTVVYDSEDVYAAPIDTYKLANNGWVVNERYPMVINGYAEILYPYDVQRCDTVSGTTDSKLSLLKQKQVLTDDLGNEMPGYYTAVRNSAMEEIFAKTFDEKDRVNSAYMQPYNGCQLDLLYKVGNVSDLSKNDLLTLDKSEDNQYFNGNLLESMRIFFNVDGIPYEDGEIVLSNDMDSASKTDFLGAVKKCYDNVSRYVESLDSGMDYRTPKETYGEFDEDRYKSFANGLGFLSDNAHELKLYCEFTYYVGAILKQKTSSDNGLVTYCGFALAENMNHGVKYTEIDELVNKTCCYHLLDGTKIYLKYFDIVQNSKEIILDDFNNQKAIINIANFEMPIRLFKENGKGGVDVSRDEFGSKFGFDQLNNFVVTPTFRKEFEFGISMPQKVNSDIYIDRGISKAFDKHLRLQEIKTMDALEQYQNGAIFNII